MTRPHDSARAGDDDGAARTATDPSVLGPPCDCWRLMWPLGPTERLPDHVCTLTMLGSVLCWWHEQGGPPPDPDRSDVWPMTHGDGRPIMLAPPTVLKLLLLAAGICVLVAI